MAQISYENGIISQATGGPIRPGGIDLTRHMLELAELPTGAYVLDVGCGTGGTVYDLHETGGYWAFGIDPSELLLQTGSALRPNLPVACGWSKSLPVASGIMDMVLAECSLCNMTDLDATLSEFQRVLRTDGKLALSDIYIRKKTGLSALRTLPLSCGLRSALPMDELLGQLQAHGFEILAWEDHSETLKYLAGQMILAHGSLSEFWSKSDPDSDPLELQIAISKAQLGYYLLVARKV